MSKVVLPDTGLMAGEMEVAARVAGTVAADQEAAKVEGQMVVEVAAEAREVVAKEEVARVEVMVAATAEDAMEVEVVVEATVAAVRAEEGLAVAMVGVTKAEA